jgi:hypothetical protein
MSKEPTPEETEKFWEWCGFRLVGKSITRSSDFPDIDLNNLFKYAVPKLLTKYDIKIFSFCDDLNEDKIFWFVQALDKKSLEVEFANIDGCEKLEDAICEVIWEVIQGEQPQR